MRQAVKQGAVPVARRQLSSEPVKVLVAVLAVGAAVALVLLLTGLRRGMGERSEDRGTGAGAPTDYVRLPLGTTPTACPECRPLRPALTHGPRRCPGIVLR